MINHDKKNSAIIELGQELITRNMQNKFQEIHTRNDNADADTDNTEL